MSLRLRKKEKPTTKLRLGKKKEKIAREENRKYESLREVMDYSRDLSIFFSGVENEGYLEGCYEVGVRDFLMSYHYLKGRPLHTVIGKYEGMKLFIDSGAYTFNNDPQFEDYSVEDWTKHIEGYLKWAEKNREYIFAIASLDIEFVVGAEQVKKWNRELFEPFMLRTGIPVCFVYHEEEAYSSWEQHCQRYPYVGLTAVNSEKLEELGIAYFKDMLRIAEKYNTLVHGMGMTRTGMLMQLPFYTVDSTTWNVGLKYGEISIWKDNHMSRIKKKDFEQKAFPVIQGYDYHFDLQDIRDEVPSVMIKVNAYAFHLAEIFIRERLKSLEYWKKAKAVKNDVDNLPDDFFPSPEELEELANGQNVELAVKYAEKMNINKEFEAVCLVVADVTVIMNWDNPDYEGFQDFYTADEGKVLKGLHDQFVNKIRETEEEMIFDLQEFFKANIAGKDETLLQMGTDFDRRQIERDEYLEDEEEYDLVDISREDTLREISRFLPSPEDLEDEGAPEIDKLDEEIFAQAKVVPVFASDGKLLKGQKMVHRPKAIYSKKFPKFVCSNCFVGSKCPEYKPGNTVCAYNKIFQKFDTRNMSDIIGAVQSITQFDLVRLQKAMIFETLNGNLDGNVSAMIETNLRHMLLLKQLYDNADAETLRQTKIVRADGSMETTTQISNPQGGVLSRLFGNLVSDKEEPKKEEPVTVEAEVVDSKKGK